MWFMALISHASPDEVEWPKEGHPLSIAPVTVILFVHGSLEHRLVLLPSLVFSKKMSRLNIVVVVLVEGEAIFSYNIWVSNLVINTPNSIFFFPLALVKFLVLTGWCFV